MPQRRAVETEVTAFPPSGLAVALVRERRPPRAAAVAAAVRERLLGIGIEETSCARRGFDVPDARMRAHLEGVGRAFVAGYAAALHDPVPERLAPVLECVEPGLRGFAFEGAGMGLALLDGLRPWAASRWAAFVADVAAPHRYLVHVGFGWAAARLPWCRSRLTALTARHDPVLRWLAVDGFGFHEGYFAWPRTLEAGDVPRGLGGYAARAFDQGLGRSLWFVRGGDPARIARAIARLAPSRHPDLWSGVGLACAYAGGVDREAITALRHAAGVLRPHLAQGAAFAAKARQAAGAPASHTETACRVLGGVSADQAAHVTDLMLTDLGPDGLDPAFETWRLRIQRWFRERRTT